MSLSHNNEHIKKKFAFETALFFIVFGAFWVIIGAITALNQYIPVDQMASYIIRYILAHIFVAKVFISFSIDSWRKSQDINYKLIRNKWLFFLDTIIGIYFCTSQVYLLSNNSGGNITPMDFSNLSASFFGLFLLILRAMIEYGNVLITNGNSVLMYGGSSRKGNGEE